MAFVGKREPSFFCFCALLALGLGLGPRERPQNAWSGKPATRGFQTTLIKSYSSLKLSDLVDDLETTDRRTERAIAVFRRIDVAKVVEEQAARADIATRSRPIAAVAVAEVTDTEQTAIDVAAITRSRVPDGRFSAELAGEVHAIVDKIV